MIDSSIKHAVNRDVNRAQTRVGGGSIRHACKISGRVSGEPQGLVAPNLMTIAIGAPIRTPRAFPPGLGFSPHPCGALGMPTAARASSQGRYESCQRRVVTTVGRRLC